MFDPAEIGSKVAKRLFGDKATAQNIKEVSEKLDSPQADKMSEDEKEEEEEEEEEEIALANSSKSFL